MNVALALEYIPRRMKELGYGTDYYIRFRHFVLQGNEKIEFDAYNQFFILVEEIADMSVQSDFGLFDIAEDKINEQTYEHQGSISINNYASHINHIRFIQVIPKHRFKK
ncbi:MAG: hypothetical protein H0U95_05025 [Bacteroidetes bacterium]|nr:hypothetical protein [Bacteroidota bacterium]